MIAHFPCRRKIFFWAVLIVLSASLLPAKTVLKVGIHDINPLAFLDSEEKARGFIIDVLQVIADREDWELVYVPGTWEQCLDRLQSRDIDLLFPVFPSEERNRLFDFSREAIFSTWGRVFSQRDQEIASILDLDHKRISGVKDDIFIEELKILTASFNLDCVFVERETSEEAFRMVEERNADAVAAERIDGHEKARQFGLSATPIIFKPGMAFFITLKNRMTGILEKLDRNLHDLKADHSSFYYTAYDRWIGSDAVRQLPRWVIFTAAAGIGLFILLLVFNVILRANVRLKTREVTAQNRRLEQEIKTRIEAERKIKMSLDEKEVLLKEIHHRVKNNMQIISSLLRLQSGSLKDRELISIFQESQSRIQSMAFIHELFYRTENLSRIDFKAYLSKVTQNLFSLYKCDRDRISLHIRGNDIHLDIGTAIPCGLIVNELVSNALKHAFPNSRKGTITVETGTHAGGKALLAVRDDGVGLPENFNFDKIQSLGLQMVRELAGQIGGTVEWKGDGETEFQIVF